MHVSCVFEIVSSFDSLFWGYFPQKVETDLSLLFLETITFFNQYMILPLNFFIKVYLFEVFAEEFTHDVVINIVLSEILNNFLSLL